MDNLKRYLNSAVKLADSQKYARNATYHKNNLIMSETYSYDNTPQTEVLSEEEQNSLEVGEQEEKQNNKD